MDRSETDPYLGQIVEFVGTRGGATFVEPAIVTQVLNGWDKPRASLVVFTAGGGIEPALAVWHESKEEPTHYEIDGSELDERPFRWLHGTPREHVLSADCWCDPTVEQVPPAERCDCGYPSDNPCNQSAKPCLLLAKVEAATPADPPPADGEEQEAERPPKPAHVFKPSPDDINICAICERTVIVWCDGYASDFQPRAEVPAATCPVCDSETGYMRFCSVHGSADFRGEA